MIFYGFNGKYIVIIFCADIIIQLTIKLDAHMANKIPINLSSHSKKNFVILYTAIIANRTNVDVIINIKLNSNVSMITNLFLL